MKSNLLVRGLFTSLIMFFVTIGCQKDQSQLVENKKEYSLEDVKELYSKQKVFGKINPKDNLPVQWEPLWDKATTKKTNDSTEYMFIPLHPYLKSDRKQKSEERGAKTYLLVKNGGEFYTGIYYGNSKEEIVDIRVFTGKMLFTNLEKGSSNLINYRNGSPYFDESVNIKKKGKSLTKMGWEENCRTEIKNCSFRLLDYSCMGQLIVVRSMDCTYPGFCTQYYWDMIDSDEVTTCYNVWVPDAPDGGGGSGSGSGSEDFKFTITNNVQNPCMRGMVDEIIDKDIVFKANETLNSIFNINGKFNIIFNESTSLANDVNGNAHPTKTYYDNQYNVTGMDIEIKLNVNNLPGSSQEYIAMVVVHESIHAYLDYKGFSYNTNQHDIMLKDYVDFIANYLKNNFNTPEPDAYSLAFGGLYGAYQNSINNQTWDSIKTKLGSKLPSLNDRSRILADYETGHKGKKCSQTP